MVDLIMSFAGYVFLIVFGMLVLQFSIIITSVLKKPKHYPENYPSVSVIIPAYNEEKSIAKTIKNVMEAYYPSEIEIIVIDDGSKDKTQDVVKKFNSVKLFEQKHSGKVAALNFGIEIA